MQATSTGDRTEERTDDRTDNPRDRTDNPSPPNKKQKVAKDDIHVDRPDLPEANLKGGLNENTRDKSYCWKWCWVPSLIYLLKT